MGRRGYPPEFRPKVLDLVEAGRPVVDVARDLGSSAEKAELTSAKRRIAESEAELAIHRRASELLGKVVPPQAIRRPSR